MDLDSDSLDSGSGSGNTAVSQLISNATIDFVHCILGDGLTSFDFTRATHTLSQSGCHFYTSSYNFQAWLSLVKLQNVMLIIQRTINWSIDGFTNFISF